MENMKEFNESLAKFFNTHIEAEKLKFGSFDNKQKWVDEQMANKTDIARAAVMFALRENGMI